MQLLCQYDVADFDAWKKDHAQDGETRGNAGLNLLQLWQEVDNANRVFCLYEVADRPRAEAYLRNDNALDSDMVSAQAHHFLDTV